ncbi:zinc-binding protein A33 [Chanos chanos]|uniref:Zinc-binding protein A33 n=1 Tax=Chanos chanos TaxID=29144 RepID=A0A6J2WJ56_CHACN|nr:zinc-binding protein A33-like [Chanos chanos]
MSSALPEENLSCPVCCDIFRDPVLLSCSHSFCRSCLQKFWATSGTRWCPVCRRTSSKRSPLSNLALRNLCEVYIQGRIQRAEAGSEVLCSMHGEKLKLFCQEDKQPICVVCQTSKIHKNHDCSPIDEAIQDCREKLAATLGTLQNKLCKLTETRITSLETVEHIKSQAHTIKKKIKDQFAELHQFLYKEEEASLSALREEEEQKVHALREKDKDNAEKISSLTKLISTIEQELTAADGTFLQNFRATMDRTQRTMQDPKVLSGMLLDEAKYLGNLKYRVWSKMRGAAQYTPVTLDPNTAHPCLSLSDDLTALHYSAPPRPPPRNAERFCISAEALGSVRLCSGLWSWDVELGENKDWILGLASESVHRRREIAARPENGFWTLCLRDGVYKAMTSPPEPLKEVKKLQKIRVHLDWDRGEVSFSDPTNNKFLYTFKHRFTEGVLPYFYTQSKLPLKILPKAISITVSEDNLPLEE